MPHFQDVCPWNKADCERRDVDRRLRKIAKLENYRTDDISSYSDEEKQAILNMYPSVR